MYQSGSVNDLNGEIDYSTFVSSSFVLPLSVCVSAGYIVTQMGLPLKLVAMVNANDIVHRTVTSGDFSMTANIKQTLAPAIDIQVL